MGILQRMSNNILLLLLNPEERWMDEKHQQTITSQHQQTEYDSFCDLRSNCRENTPQCLICTLAKVLI